jgi:hypothetical protein
MWQPFSWFIFIWVFILAGMFAIGGYFMFRKFLKVLPMADGKSKLDWQNYYVEKSRHLWTDDSKAFLVCSLILCLQRFAILRNTQLARELDNWVWKKALVKLPVLSV